MASSFDYDLFVIGAGSGGVRAARVSAGYGARVAIAEEFRYGGTCVIRGCVPKKLLVYASSYRDSLSLANSFGWTIQGEQFDWTTLLANKDAEVDRLNRIYVELLKNAGVTLHSDRAELVGPHSVRVGDKIVRARNILIATGATPHTPDIPGIELGITSNEAFHLDTLPKHIVIVGGGYIGIEFAHIFRGFGANTTLVHRGNKLLRGFDEDVRDQVAHNLVQSDIHLQLQTEIRSIQKQNSGELSIVLSDDTTLKTDIVLFATGRQPNTQIGLSEIGIRLDRDRAVIVDQYSRTNIQHIFAVGDCTNRMNLTPVAIAEGQAFAQTVFGSCPTKIDYRFIPSAVFSQPPAAVVGITETEARMRYEAIDIYYARFRPMKLSLANAPHKTLMKLIVDTKTDRVLGAHMVGEDAAEIIQCIALLFKQELQNNSSTQPWRFIPLRRKNSSLCAPSQLNLAQPLA